MRITLIWSFLLVLNLNCAVAVKKLTSESDIPSTGLTVVKCHANWCGHCKHYAPTYEKVANEYAGKANFYEVESEDPLAKEFNPKYKVQGFPTTLFFKNGQKLEDEVSGNNEEGLRSALEKNLATTETKEVVTAQPVKEESKTVATTSVPDLSDENDLKQPGHVVLKFEADWCSYCKTLDEAFGNIVNNHSDHAKFYKLDYDTELGKRLGKKFKVEGLPAVIFYDNGKEVDRASSAEVVEMVLSGLRNGTTAKVVSVEEEAKPVKKVQPQRKYGWKRNWKNKKSRYKKPRYDEDAFEEEYEEVDEY